MKNRLIVLALGLKPSSFDESFRFSLLAEGLFFTVALGQAPVVYTQA